ncbi:MAG: hypothetical protein OXE94_00865 [Aestuariivita sp.]|nr:hypothetical protein [Aestuariivita sp.]MCY4201048.1 hypothetical protein [Aestuariivita sp.]MCY4288452.1 hypothetical protein [Aestuariivita sp.]MCY4347619.1 hypothetical protein [Aestuariivita sp.]
MQPAIVTYRNSDTDSITVSILAAPESAIQSSGRIYDECRLGISMLGGGVCLLVIQPGNEYTKTALG